MGATEEPPKGGQEIPDERAISDVRKFSRLLSRAPPIACIFDAAVVFRRNGIASGAIPTEVALCLETARRQPDASGGGGILASEYKIAQTALP